MRLGCGVHMECGYVSEQSDSGKRCRCLQQRTGPVSPCGAIATACFMVGGDMLCDGRHIEPFDVFVDGILLCEAAAVSPTVSDTVILVEGGA